MPLSSLQSILLILLMYGHSPLWAALPEDAKAMLESFPEKKVTIDLVIGRAVQFSDSFKALQSQLTAVDVPLLRARASLDTRINGKINQLDDQTENQISFNPNKINSTKYSVSAGQYFSSGTSADLELAHGRTLLGFASGTDSDAYETRATLSLSQNLWRDAFGMATRRSLIEGETLKKVAVEAYHESIESWVWELLQVYYGAWLAQSQVEVARENVQRRERLLQITKIKLNRGTAEQPDVLQVRSALLTSQVQLAAAEQTLRERWQGLVISLKLPQAWLTLDAREIPMGLDQPFAENLAACGDEMKTVPDNSTLAKRLALQAEAARANLERSHNLTKPEVKLVAQMTANGIDPSTRSQSVDEVSGFDNTAWAVGLTFAMTLPSENVALRSAYAENIKTQALAAQATDNLQLDWLTACGNLKRLVASTERLREAYENQKQRAKLDEERFGIGRTTTLGVIQSGDDASLAGSNLRSSEVETRLAAWKVRRLITGFKPYLEELHAKNH